ncbi:CubicO group peptidase (beta-lactamase class C family) [Haloferula luteola]|uniref:CubicO group peptidase (Beta-lactamase class C family) n=1 Tax=Haloferula luteola TaxID=595692 RepID=A0A840VDC1_9BACT|nr:serine hydrolase domain-containing protein [Haloferula luteola]MBB5352628.1 CubicO group peptidase (beta-lactamase class C family) [Haloferula luteola]
MAENEKVNRRHWLLLAGGGWVGGCLPFSGGGVRSWDRGTLDEAEKILSATGCRGWGAWEEGTLKKAWRTHEQGPVMSITKTLAMLGGVKAAEQGWLSLDERVAETLTEWQGVEGKQEIRIQMLLQMTAGLDEGVAALYRAHPQDKGSVAMALPLREAPGEGFRYGPACWELLGEVLKRKCAARGTTVERFLQSAVMRPIGLTGGDWKKDGSGQIYLSTGAELTVTGLGRLGRTLVELLNGRDAAGLSASHFRAWTRPSSANSMFGGGLWRNRGSREIEVEDQLDQPQSAAFWNGACLSRHQPGSLVALIGSSGQRVWIWPEEGRVLARLGYSPQWKDRPLLAVV